MVTRAWLLSGFLTFAALLQVQAAEAPITYTMPKLYAEGIAFNPVSNEFLVSSLHYGVIGAVGMDGKYRQWSRSGGEKFPSSFGIKVDALRGRALVCVADLGVSVNSSDATKHKFSGVAAYDLNTGQLRGFTDLARLLPGEHFANDLTVDLSGNIYVTDSYAPVVYKIDWRGVPSVAFKDVRFEGEGIKLNGIVAHPDGYLLAVRMDTGALFKLDPRTNAVTQVTLPAPLTGGDGLLLDEDGELIVVQNDKGIVQWLASTDGWQSAHIHGGARTPLHYPTTATWANDKPYVLEAKLPELFDANAPKSDSFAIVPLQFVADAVPTPVVAQKPKRHVKGTKAKKKRSFKETVVAPEAATQPKSDAVKADTEKTDAAKPEAPKSEVSGESAAPVAGDAASSPKDAAPAQPEVLKTEAPKAEEKLEPAVDAAPKQEAAPPLLPDAMAPKAEEPLALPTPTPPKAEDLTKPVVPQPLLEEKP